MIWGGGSKKGKKLQALLQVKKKLLYGKGEKFISEISSPPPRIINYRPLNHLFGRKI